MVAAETLFFVLVVFWVTTVEVSCALCWAAKRWTPGPDEGRYKPCFCNRYINNNQQRLQINNDSKPIKLLQNKNRTFLAGFPKRFFLRAVDPSNRPMRLSDSGVAAISEKRCASWSRAACPPPKNVF